MSDIISISASAFAIFSADESCGRPPPKRKDIVEGVLRDQEKRVGRRKASDVVVGKEPCSAGLLLA